MEGGRGEGDRKGGGRVRGVRPGPGLHTGGGDAMTTVCHERQTAPLVTGFRRGSHLPLVTLPVLS